MLDILNLALPFFGLIFIGFACGKLKKLPDEGLAWMNFFILYVALPALFFRILSKTPFEQLAQVDFIKATTLATAGAFAISFCIGLALRRGKLGDATLAAVAGGFGNVGYMGPGLALATLGPGGRGAGGADLLVRRTAGVHAGAAADGVQRFRAHEHGPGTVRRGGRHHASTRC